MFQNSGINKVLLVGRIDEDVKWSDGEEQRYLQFPLVTKEVFAKNGSDTEHLEFHQVKIPSHIVNGSSKDMQKGRLLYLEGKVQTHSFVDATGVKRYVSEVLVNRFNFLG